jgi:hypothetical protein
LLGGGSRIGEDLVAAAQKYTALLCGLDHGQDLMG